MWRLQALESAFEKRLGDAVLIPPGLVKPAPAVLGQICSAPRAQETVHKGGHANQRQAYGARGQY